MIKEDIINVEMIKEMPILELKDIANVYVGKPNRCMCGCSDTYYYPSVNQEYAGKKEDTQLMMTK